MSMPTQEGLHWGLPPKLIEEPLVFCEPQASGSEWPSVCRDLSTSAGQGRWPEDKVLRRAQVRGEPWPVMGLVPGQQHGDQ